MNQSELPLISIIILNWNGWHDTIECLESVYQIDYSNFDVVIIDNASIDKSISKIKDYCEGKIELKSNFVEYSKKDKPINFIEYSKEEIDSLTNDTNIKSSNPAKNIILIKNDKNYGFAEANNIGIIYSIRNLNPKYVLLLNNDTIVSKESLKKLVEVADTDEKIGAVGPMVYHYGYTNKIQSVGAKILWNRGISNVLGVNEIDNGQYNGVNEVDSLVGCALLVKTSLFGEIGFLMNDYFAYWEEVEWCIRAKKANYKIINVPTAKIWHKGGSSSKKVSGFYEYHFTRNMIWFTKKHASKKQYIIFLIYFFGYRFWFTSFVHLLYHRNNEAFQSFIKGIIDGIQTH